MSIVISGQAAELAQHLQDLKDGKVPADVAYATSEALRRARDKRCRDLKSRMSEIVHAAKYVGTYADEADVEDSILMLEAVLRYYKARRDGFKLKDREDLEDHLWQEMIAIDQDRAEARLSTDRAK